MMSTMTQAKTSEQVYSEQRRQRAAELIAAIVKRRRRESADEALLDQAASRAMELQPSIVGPERVD
jgi:hypothetical protein